MASKYWIKLYHEILDDPKMGRLSDRLWRRTVELFLIAGDYEQDGELPAVGDMAWRLRTTEKELAAELAELENIGIVTQNGVAHIVTNFAKRQAAVSDAERMRRHRDRNRTGNDNVTESVTIRNTDEDIDTDTEKKKTEEDNGANAPATSSSPVPSSFPEWLELLKTSSNKAGALGFMYQTLYKQDPDYQRIAALAKKSGSASALATILWNNATRALVNPIDYITKVVSGNGNGRNGNNGGKPSGTTKPAGLSESDWASLQYIQYNHDEDAALYRAELEAKGVKVDDWLSAIS